jgi:uncharacterized surface protein with fasciclin (FAS1) repeats
MRGIVGALLIASLAACGGGDDGDQQAATIVQVAQKDSRFSVLVEAVQAAGLTETLSAPGPYTVFAPTNDAFTALLAELGLTKDQLFANKTLLTAVLKYHVVAGSVSSAQVPLGKAITPVGGGFFKVDKVGADLVVTDGRNRTSKIVQADVAASNGVIHAVDKVLLPADKNVVQNAMANPNFSILVEAVTAAGLGNTLSGTGPFTVFAPTNAAFSALLAELGVTKDQLFADKALLTKVLTYHVLPALVLKADVQVNTPITTVEGETFVISPALAITDRRGRQANITATDILASNGVVHVVDKVILPAP